MKNLTKLFLAAIVAVMAWPNITGQIKIKPNGQVLLGNYLYEDSAILTLQPDRRDSLTMLKIMGYGTEASGARLSFGDHLSSWSNNVVIGELSRHNDTDVLWMHGKKGLFFTSTAQNERVTRSQYVIANDVFAGRSVDANRTAGDLTIAAGSEYEIETKGTVTLAPGFAVEKGALFSVTRSDY